ncbi:MAG TPA: methyltransferase domain-containing protein [Candidatus Limnocylindrales bacterium]|nr:methyltransferase domain-containing protein [Candidatus Limnocylindrales bacterium]
MDRLTGVEELIDGPLDDAGSLGANLRDLARLNRLTGGAALSVQAVRALLPIGGTVLDVGTGAADIPVRLLADSRRRGTTLTVTATDSRPEVIDAAIALRPGLTSVPGLVLGLADGRGLDWPDGAFDVAHSSMVLHHLTDEEAIRLLVELRRVARIGVVTNDLDRGRLAWLGGWLLTHTLAASRYTRHDGPLSVRRAYTRQEMGHLLEQAGLKPVVTFAGFAGHRYAIAAVPA